MIKREHFILISVLFQLLVVLFENLQGSALVVVETADGSGVVFEEELHDIVVGSATAQLHEKEMDWKIALRVGDGKAPLIDEGLEDCEICVEECRAMNGQVLSIIEDANCVGIGLEDCNKAAAMIKRTRIILPRCHASSAFAIRRERLAIVAQLLR